MALNRLMVILASLVLAALVVAGCSGSNSPTPANTPATGAPASGAGAAPGAGSAAAPAAPAQSGAQPAGSSAMSAEVNGKAWNSSIVAAATYQNQFFGLSGIDAGGTGITLGIANVTGPGAYTLNFMNGNGSSGIVANSSGQGWTPFPRVARALSPSPP